MKFWQMKLLISGLLIIFILAGCSKKTTTTPDLITGDETTVQTPTETSGSASGAKKTKSPDSEFDFSKFENKDADFVLPDEQNVVFEDINFDFDRYELPAPAREILARHAAILKRYQNLKILIEGHCDERGTIEYNLALGERRANTVKQYLMNYSISPERLSTVTYGKERPISFGNNEEAWAKNRRAAFKIIAR